MNREVADNAPFWWRWWYYWWAAAYYEAVRLGGKLAFSYRTQGEELTREEMDRL